MVDQAYLLTQQYQDASKLQARIGLHARFSINRHGWYPWVFDQLRLAPHSRILELGCGSGLFWLTNVDRLPAGWEITLSDLSAGMVAQAQTLLRDSGRAFTFVVADAQDLPFADAYFDAVLANHMLYHVPNVPRALADVRRVLRRQGVFYAATNGRRHLQELGAFVPTLPPGASFGEEYSFNLDNGAEMLGRVFDTVHLHRYDDALAVTEAAPLVDFILSSPLTAALDDTAKADVKERVGHALAQQGTIHVTKETGLFECR